MLFLSTIFLAFGMSLQTMMVPSFEGDIFTEKEAKKLQKEKDINDRIKIYTDASKRIQKRLSKSASRNQYHNVPDELKLWMELLTKSLKDIETNLEPGKKSKNLIKYEIQVRKSMAEMEDYAIRAPYEQQDLFDAFLKKAERIRQGFVALIFP